MQILIHSVQYTVVGTDSQYCTAILDGPLTSWDPHSIDPSQACARKNSPHTKGLQQVATQQHAPCCGNRLGTMETGSGRLQVEPRPDTPASAAALARSSHAYTTFSSTPGSWPHGQQPPGDNTFFVDLRFNLFKVTAVNTVDGTAFVNFGIVCYWTDSRLIDWPEGTALPPELWGPHLMLLNALAGLQEVESSFDLVNRDTGRLKRGREFKGTVDINMDLRAFPFDMGSIEMLFYSASHWLSLNGEKQCSGSRATSGKTYRLRQVCEEDEGKWLNFLWSGAIPEWTLHGVSTKIVEKIANPQGQEHTNVPVSFHVTRKARYYFWKALLPLYLLTLLSMSTFHFDCDDFEGRSSTVSTYFLAAFAMLYVVGSSLPKVNFLTTIDVVIVLTTLTITFTGIISLVLVKVEADLGKGAAERCNLIAEVAIIALYVMANLIIFGQPYLKLRRAVAKLTHGTQQGGYDRPLPTVQEGCEYATLKALVPKAKPNDFYQDGKTLLEVRS